MLDLLLIHLSPDMLFGSKHTDDPLRFIYGHSFDIRSGCVIKTVEQVVVLGLVGLDEGCVVIYLVYRSC